MIFCIANIPLRLQNTRQKATDIYGFVLWGYPSDSCRGILEKFTISESSNQKGEMALERCKTGCSKAPPSFVVSLLKE